MVAANKEERARAAAEAEVLLREEQLAFEAWRDSLETVPTIKALRGKVGAGGCLAGAACSAGRWRCKAQRGRGGRGAAG